MKSRNIRYSDLELLAALFIGRGTSISVFDPGGRVVYDRDAPTEGNGPRVLVNLGGSIEMYRGMELHEFDLVLDFGSIRTRRFGYGDRWNFFQTPEGFLHSMTSPGKSGDLAAFLRARSFRTRAVASYLNVMGWLGLDRFLSHGRLTVYGHQPLKPEQQLPDETERYCVHFGKPTAERTPVVAAYEGRRCTHFLKVAMDEHAFRLQQNERRALVSMSRFDLPNIIVPEVGASRDSDVLLTSNIRPLGRQRQELFGLAQQAFIQSMIRTSSMALPLYQTDYWESSMEGIWKLHTSRNAQIRELAQMLHVVRGTLPVNTLLISHIAHGNFTSWNMFEEGDRLYLFNWGMYQRSAPALFDFFHFHYQQGILVDRVGLDVIRGRIATGLPAFTSMPELQNIDAEALHRLYLTTALPILLARMDAKNLTMSQRLQLRVWKQAVQHYIPQNDAISDRVQILEDLHGSLVLLPHAFLKFNAPSLTEFSEAFDLDIALPVEHLDAVLDNLQHHPLVRKCNVYRKSFMCTAELFLRDGGYLSVDFIHRFMRKDLEMLDADLLLRDAVMNDQAMRVPALKHDLMYAYAFYTLNGTPIPMKYFSLFSSRTGEEVEQALSYLNYHAGTDFKNLAQVFLYERALRDVLRHHLRNAQRHPWRNLMRYIGDTISSLRQRKGFVITFSGVDVAGKSAVVQEVRDALERRYRRDVVLFQHRPGLLPMLRARHHGESSREESIAGDAKPRQAEMEIRTFKLLRFAYCYADFLLGQAWVHMRYLLRGKIVLYDRYYFDFIHDARRSNIQISRRVARRLYALVTKPRLNFFLYSDPATILQRTQEMSAHDISEVSASYRALFQELESQSNRSRYRSVENVLLANTVNHVLREFEKVA